MTMTLSRRSSSRAFTLIELLVVIAIIVLLAGLAFPAINLALIAAKKAQASAQINQLRVSLTAYQTEYGTWPAAFSTTSETTVESCDNSTSSTDLYKTLIAKKTGTSYPTDNPRGIVFMEFNAKDLRAAAASSTNKQPPADPSTAVGFVDPWSQSYRLLADTNYDNELDVPSDTTGTVKINAGLAIWSRGPQKTWDTQLDPRKNYIRSWK